jgi:hypothetical protein
MVLSTHRELPGIMDKRLGTWKETSSLISQLPSLLLYLPSCAIQSRIFTTGHIIDDIMMCSSELVACAGRRLRILSCHGQRSCGVATDLPSLSCNENFCLVLLSL